MSTTPPIPMTTRATATQETQRILEASQLLAKRIVTRDRLVQLGAPHQPLELAAQGIDCVLEIIATTATRLHQIEKLEEIFQRTDRLHHEGHLSPTTGDWFCDKFDSPYCDTA